MSAFSTRIGEYEGRYVLSGDIVPRCGECGAVVADTDLHTEWHKGLLVHIASSIISGTGASMKGHLAGSVPSNGDDR